MKRAPLINPNHSDGKNKTQREIDDELEKLLYAYPLSCAYLFSTS